MFGLFLLVCYTYQPCDYVPQGGYIPIAPTASTIFGSSPCRRSTSVCRLMR